MRAESTRLGELRPGTTGAGQLATSRTAFPAEQGNSGSGPLLLLFLVSLLIPISFDLAGLRLSPYRLVLLILFVPLLVRLLSGKAGRLNLVDAGLAGFSLWMVVTLVYHHGAERFPYAMILAVEVFGGYMVGRLLIRNAADYRVFIRYFVVALALLAPFALYELYFSRMPISDLLRSVFDATKKNQAFRFGLSRVQVVFPHSILYGLFCSLALASVYYIYRSSLIRMVPRFLLVAGMTIMSLSSAPLMSIGLQVLMIAWDKLTRGNWKLFTGLVLSIYVFLQVATSRGAVVILIESLTFSPQSGWWRIHIWRHGSASVLNHPIMGIGLNDWERPDWLASTVDNFWLLMAMRHGLVGFAFLGMAIALHATYMFRASIVHEGTRIIRVGYGVTLMGLCFVLSTVHIWNELAVFVMFFLGAGSFLYSAPAGEPSEELADSAGNTAVMPRGALRFSRFPQTPGMARDGKGADEEDLVRSRRTRNGRAERK